MAVGAALGVSHTTISRWETGAVPLTTKELEDLAKLYGISRRQIEHSPESIEMISFLDRAQHVVKRLSAEDLNHWISRGESLTRK